MKIKEKNIERIVFSWKNLLFIDDEKKPNSKAKNTDIGKKKYLCENTDSGAPCPLML